MLINMEKKVRKYSEDKIICHRDTKANLKLLPVALAKAGTI